MTLEISLAEVKSETPPLRQPKHPNGEAREATGHEKFAAFLPNQIIGPCVDPNHNPHSNKADQLEVGCQGAVPEVVGVNVPKK